MTSIKSQNQETRDIFIIDHQGEALSNFKFLMERGVGIFLRLDNSEPQILMNGGNIVRPIKSFSAVYRKGDDTQYCIYEHGKFVSNSDAMAWNILLIIFPSYTMLYLEIGNALVIAPEATPFNNSDFMELAYSTADYTGTIHLDYSVGKPMVFSNVTVDFYGMYGELLVNEMASLAMDIHAVKHGINLQ